MVGDVLADRYELEELVGTGGMSSVFRAHDRLLARKVALKILHPALATDEVYVERFRREARAVASLSHPNIVTVIDRGEYEGRQFIVFEYVEGDNLKEQIARQGPASLTVAVELGLQIALALSFAHRNGLVHRDVKPQNVLLTAGGKAKVTDFGIARSLDVQQGATQTGTVLGTSDYIAPEQAQGGRVDEQSDVYSLGIVLYELLTGDVPFPGENFVAVALRHINDPPPSVRDKRPEVPPRLDAAIKRALAKDPADRFPTMADFGRKLEACLGELQRDEVTLSTPALGSARRHRRTTSPWPLVLVLAALLAIGAAVAYLLVHGTGGSPASGASSGVVRLAAITAYDPDGDHHEHDSLAPRATDGIPSTYWETERYFDAPSLGKAGVGLVLDAGSPVRLHSLEIVTATPGFTAEIEAGDSPTSFPDVVARARTVGDDTRFSVAGRKHRYYLVWITRLGGGYQFARINEVKAS